MIRRITKISAVFAAISLFFLCTFLSLELSVFDYKFYEKEFEKLNTENRMEISNEDLIKTVYVLLDYIKDKRDNINCTVIENNYEVQMFSKREELHMVDVKNLFMIENKIIKYTLFCSLFFLSVTAVIIANNKSKKLVYFKESARTFLYAFISLIILLAFLAAAFVLDFNSSWDKFHEIFFTNDLWQLDPDTDRMINMFNLEFFEDMLKVILIKFSAFMLLITSALILLLIYIKKVKTKIN